MFRAHHEPSSAQTLWISASSSYFILRQYQDQRHEDGEEVPNQGVNLSLAVELVFVSVK